MRLFVALFMLSVAAIWAGPLDVRPSPEFSVRMPDGSQFELSQYRGKVVALEFIYTTCPHCQASAQMMTRLYREYGPRGFQPVAVAFNPMAILLVPEFVKQFQVTFPVGFSVPETVHQFLDVPVTRRLMVPQLLFIDRKGVIRAQSPALGDEKFYQESSVRAMIEKLLNEGGDGAVPSSQPTTSKKKSS
jgi:peroxiredoxin